MQLLSGNPQLSGAIRTVCLICLGLAILPANAEEPVLDGQVNLAWWSNNVDVDPVDASFDAGSVGGDAEAWWRHRWGLKGSLYKSDVVQTNSSAGTNFLSIDLKRRVLSATEHNFLALGLGWENINVGESVDTYGPRLVVQGSLGVTPLLSIYGHTAWLPALQESDQLQNPDGIELEAGLALRPLPNLSFRAGYREFRLDFKSLEGANDSAKSKGVMFGAGVNF